MSHQRSVEQFLSRTSPKVNDEATTTTFSSPAFDQHDSIGSLLTPNTTVKIWNKNTCELEDPTGDRSLFASSVNSFIEELACQYGFKVELAALVLKEDKHLIPSEVISPDFVDIHVETLTLPSSNPGPGSDFVRSDEHNYAKDSKAYVLALSSEVENEFGTPLEATRISTYPCLKVLQDYNTIKRALSKVKINLELQMEPLTVRYNLAGLHRSGCNLCDVMAFTCAMISRTGEYDRKIVLMHAALSTSVSYTNLEEWFGPTEHQPLTKKWYLDVVRRSLSIK